MCTVFFALSLYLIL